MDELRRLAVDLAQTPFHLLTKAGVRRAVWRRRLLGGGVNRKARIQAAFDLARQIIRLRANRFFARYVRPVPDLRTRLFLWRRSKGRAEEPSIQAWVAIHQARFRQAGERRPKHHVTVEVVQHEAEVGAFGDSFWASSKRRGSEHRFLLPKDWRASVHEPGLALLNGRLTLLVDRRDDVVRRGQRIEVFRAVWCRQGRGYSLVTQRGFIARLGPHTCHGQQHTARRAAGGPESSGGQ